MNLSSPIGSPAPRLSVRARSLLPGAEGSLEAKLSIRLRVCLSGPQEMRAAGHLALATTADGRPNPGGAKYAYDKLLTIASRCSSGADAKLLLQWMGEDGVQPSRCVACRVHVTSCHVMSSYCSSGLGKKEGGGGVLGSMDGEVHIGLFVCLFLSVFPSVCRERWQPPRCCDRSSEGRAMRSDISVMCGWKVSSIEPYLACTIGYRCPWWGGALLSWPPCLPVM
jgi:hypothetical protein